MVYYGTEMNALNLFGQKVKVQGHSAITYAGTIITQVEAHSTRCLVSS